MLSRKFLYGSTGYKDKLADAFRAMKRLRARRILLCNALLMGHMHLMIGMVILVLIFHPLAATTAEKAPKETEQQKISKRQANLSLSRLKHAIKTDGFYNCRVALNVWEMNAKEAGTFDQELYNTFKKQIYDKSLTENLRWFEIFLNLKNYYDARICLQLWRMHAREMGVYDEAKYEEMKKKLK